MALFMAAVLSSPPAAADETIGGACTSSTAAGPQAANGNNVLCVSSVWKYPAYQFGSASLGCTTTVNNGTVEWTGNSFAGCTTSGSTTRWETLGTINVSLGSITTTDPSRSGALSTGFYTAGAGLVDVAITGTNIEQWASTGETIAGTYTANSFIPNGATVPTNGMYQSAANKIDFATSSAKALEIDTTGNLDIVKSTGNLQLGGTTVITNPDSGAATTSLAIGASALNSQSATNSNNTAVGYEAGDLVSTGTGNTAIGYVALNGNALNGSTTALTGNYNTAVGNLAMQAIFGAAGYNTTIGNEAGQSITTGTNNTIYASGAGYYRPTTGSGNILVGDGANGTETVSNSTSNAIALGANNTLIGSTDIAIGQQAFTAQTTDNNHNIVIGTQAGFNLSSGVGNIAVGLYTMTDYSTPITGTYNTILGPNSYAGLTTGSQNTAMGNWTGTGTSTGSSSVAIGFESLNNGNESFDVGIGQSVWTTGVSDSYNVGAGAALGTVTTSMYNVGIGQYALNSLSNNSNGQIGIGSAAGVGITSGTGNVALGASALFGIYTGAGNTGIGENVATGAFAGYCGTCAGLTGVGNGVMYWASANDQTAFGYNADSQSAGGTGVTAIGQQALNSVSTGGNGNTAIGYTALYSATGIDNTGIGYNSGNSITSGTKNTAIGYGANIGAANTNSTAIGYMASTTTSNVMQLGNSSVGVIYCGNCSALTSASDRRLKKDIAESDLGLDFIEKLKPVSYRFKNGNDMLRYGFIAQEMEQALPQELQEKVENHEVTPLALMERAYDEEGTYRVTYGELIAPVVKSIQERQAKLDAMRARLDALKAAHDKKEAELDKLRQKIAELEARHSDNE
jgi:hypothetical protein